MPKVILEETTLPTPNMGVKFASPQSYQSADTVEDTSVLSGVAAAIGRAGETVTDYLYKSAQLELKKQKMAQEQAAAVQESNDTSKIMTEGARAFERANKARMNGLNPALARQQLEIDLLNTVADTKLDPGKKKELYDTLSKNLGEKFNTQHHIVGPNIIYFDEATGRMNTTFGSPEAMAASSYAEMQSKDPDKINRIRNAVGNDINLVNAYAAQENEAALKDYELKMKLEMRHKLLQIQGQTLSNQKTQQEMELGRKQSQGEIHTDAWARIHNATRSERDVLLTGVTRGTVDKATAVGNYLMSLDANYHNSKELPSYLDVAKYKEFKEAAKNDFIEQLDIADGTIKDVNRIAVSKIKKQVADIDLLEGRGYDNVAAIDFAVGRYRDAAALSLWNEAKEVAGSPTKMVAVFTGLVADTAKRRAETKSVVEKLRIGDVSTPEKKQEVEKLAGQVTTEIVPALKSLATKSGQFTRSLDALDMFSKTRVFSAALNDPKNAAMREETGVILSRLLYVDIPAMKQDETGSIILQQHTASHGTPLEVTVKRLLRDINWDSNKEVK